MTFSPIIPVLYILGSISGDFDAGTKPGLFYDLSSNNDCK